MSGTHTFLVRTTRALLTQVQAPQLVEASCYEPEDGYINFRDTNGHKVFTVQGSLVFSIERVSDTGPTAELRELMKKADASDRAILGTVTDRAVGTDGGITETTYRVAVEAVQAETLDAAAPEVHVHVNGSVVTEQQLADCLDATLTRLSRRYRNSFKR